MTKRYVSEGNDGAGGYRALEDVGVLHAIIVGVDRYRDPAVGALSCAAADATALASLIERRVAPSERKIRLLVNEQATRRNIMAAVGDDLHREVEEDDVVLLYFAGHGSPERRSRRERRARFLIPHDAEYERIYATGIDMDRDVANWLERLGNARLVVLLLDSCFSGAAAGRSFMGPILSANPTLPDYLDDDTPISLRKLDLGRGRAVLCAADDDQSALEDEELGHGVFTYHLLDALRRPRQGSSTLGVTELYDEIFRAVRHATAGAQEPVISLVKSKGLRLPCLA